MSENKFFEGDDLAYSTFLNKYSYNREETPKDVNLRMAREFAKIEKKYNKRDKANLSDYGKNRIDLTESRIFELFNSYTVIPQGSVQAVLGTPLIASISNCFVAPSPIDSYGGIYYTDQILGQLMKRRAGVGTDMSGLRPEGTTVNNAAKSSTGAVSFMHRFSNTTREVSQSGRRGALMLTMDVKHPDILEFIKIKRDLTKVTGANISVKLTDDFMKAVENDEDYFLRFPVNHPVRPGWKVIATEYNKLEHTLQDGNVYFKKVRAKEIWDELIKSAHNVAEPGVMYWDRMVNYAPDGVYEELKPISTNPCFTGNMRILTDKGYKTFNELEDKTLNLINKNGEQVKGKVFSTGIKNTIILKLSNGETIQCTPDHKFLTIDDEVVEAKDLIRKRIKPLIKINKENSLFVKLGFIQGDGNLSRLNSKKHKGLEINFNLKKDKDVIKLFNYKVTNRKYYATEFTDILKSLGFSKKTLPYRELPNSFNNWDLFNKKQFIRGLFSANGGVIKGYRVSLKSTNKKLINDVKKFLKEIGIDSYITKNKEKTNKFYNGIYTLKKSFDLNIGRYESVKLFAEKIGFVQSYKNKDLHDLILQKAPKVLSIKLGKTEKVYDFTLYDKIHWGVVEGVVAHNCGEIALPAYDSCRLIAINFTKFVDKPFTSEAKFNFQKFYKVAYETQRLADDLVDLELLQVKKIIEKIKKDPEPNYIKQVELDLWNNIYNIGEQGRRTGVGLTGLGDMLAMLNIKYDSEDALDIVDNIMKVKMKAELDSTIDMAVERKPFPKFDINKEFEFFDCNKEYGFCFEGKNDFYEFLKNEYGEHVYKMIKFGRRNVSWSTVAPTGTISMLAGVTSGIEPLFMPYYIRRVKVVGNEKVDFVDDNGDKWKEVTVLHRTFKNWLKYQIDNNFTNEEKDTMIENMPEDIIKEWFELSPWYKATAPDIDPIKRNTMQSIIQKYTTHSISSTINLKETISEKVVSDIYKDGYSKKLKGQTVYRDGARSGVLITTTNNKNNSFDYHDSIKRPEELEAEAMTIQVAGNKYAVYIGFMNEKPYEVFVRDGYTKEGKGKIIKIKKGDYFFIGNDENSRERVITDKMTQEQALITRLVSGNLRHGRHFKYIVEDIDKSGAGIFDFSTAIKKALAKFMKNDDVTDKTCPSCGMESVVYEEGCKVCKSCGWSACG